MNPEFITLIISIMNSGFIPTFRARSDHRETMKIRLLSVPLLPKPNTDRDKSMIGSVFFAMKFSDFLCNATLRRFVTTLAKMAVDKRDNVARSVESLMPFSGCFTRKLAPKSAKNFKLAKQLAIFKAKNIF